MFRNILPLILSMCIVSTIGAQTIYLKMDETCMDRLEYSTGDSENPYVSYSFKLGDKQFATFDIGMESKNWVNDLPGKVTNCNTLKIDKAFVQKVNDGRIKLHVVRAGQANYHVAAVDKASLLETMGGSMDYMGDDVAFSLSLDNPVSGINLALPGSKNEIYLEGTINYQCLKGFILQKKESSNSRTFKEYVMVPQVGLVERSSVAKTGFVDDLLRDNVYRLNKIDEKSFKTILAEACDKLQATYYDGVATNDKLQPKSGTPTSYGNGDPCSPSQEPGVHIVQKGETLYAISRKYGVPVAQLLSWNNLADGNVIGLCQRLWVKQPSSGSTSTTTETTTTTTTTETTTPSDGYWTKTAAEHQVRSGETVASLAKMYGYTEERFRKMNGLSATEIIRQGQRLRTNDCNCPTLETATKDTPLPYEQPSETAAPTETTPKAIDNKDVYYRPITVHLVKATDTWYSIAKQYNTTVERILELNGMTKDDKLSSDQRIYVQ